MMLETAVNGRAGALVTHNARDFANADTLRHRRYARQDGVSLNQFISAAVAEKVGAVGAAEYFEKRGRGGRRDRAVAFLGDAPNTPPAPGDELPD